MEWREIGVSFERIKLQLTFKGGRVRKREKEGRKYTLEEFSRFSAQLPICFMAASSSFSTQYFFELKLGF